MNRFSVADSATDTAREAISVLRDEFEEAIAEAKRMGDPDEPALRQTGQDIEDLVGDLADLVTQARFYLEEARELEVAAENAREELSEALDANEEPGPDWPGWSPGEIDGVSAACAACTEEHGDA